MYKRQVLTHPRLLMIYAITALGYGGVFTAFTFLAPMMRSLYTGATGMVAQQLNIDVISNNLANVNSTGFKKSRAQFEDLMYQTMKIAGSLSLIHI